MRYWSRRLYFSVGAACLLAVYMKINVVDKRQQMFKDFYDNWDDEKEFERMKKAGVFKGFEL